MQLSRIKRMSEKRKAEWIIAINELAEDYKSDQHDYLDCPLCRVSAECDGCLWPIIEGCECDDYVWSDGYIGVASVYDKNYKEWKIHRLKMLERWRLIIKFSQKNFLNGFETRMEEIEKAFEVLGKELAKKLKPIGEFCKEVNEAIEKIEKEKKN